MRLVVLSWLLWLAAVQVLAQDSPDAEARRLFDEGFALSESNRWSEAADCFERSLALVDRPGTRFNLMNAYVELGRPLDVARHALAFLSLPPEPHRAEARASTEAALADATRQLAVLGTASVPAGTVVLVDGSEKLVRDATRVFVQPGLHRLEARIPGGQPEVIELHLAPGQALPWPRQGRIEPLVPTPLVVTPALPKDEPVGRVSASDTLVSDVPTAASVAPEWRTRLSITTGTLGALVELTAVGLFAFVQNRGNALPRANQAGYLSAVRDFPLAAANSVAPLAAAGGVLMAQAVATGPRSSRWGSRATAIVALAAGAGLLAAGTVLVVREPTTFVGTTVEQPSRQAGALLLSGAGPLVSYGVSFLVHWGQSPQEVKVTLGPRR